MNRATSARECDRSCRVRRAPIRCRVLELVVIGHTMCVLQFDVPRQIPRWFMQYVLRHVTLRAKSLEIVSGMTPLWLIWRNVISSECAFCVYLLTVCFSFRSSRRGEVSGRSIGSSRQILLNYSYNDIPLTSPDQQTTDFSIFGIQMSSSRGRSMLSTRMPLYCIYFCNSILYLRVCALVPCQRDAHT